ncbi:hypothetical protein FHU33_0490 [Blastococcus colisei]|uniref:Uncharacterized protein n=1 Tax=Blastococcus colisei TaxID=1564162 RepID=A0A543PAM9_9ACTN|nr:hypothetical protein FHU33_0490 [Blastococcus colisei]
MVALLVVVAAGCGTTVDPVEPARTEDAAAPSAEPVPGLQAEAVRLRTDEAVGGRFQVRVTNTGDEAFTVTAVALDSPGFTALPAATRTTEFAPGRVIDLPTAYGEPVCDAGPVPAAAQLSVARPGGVTESVRVPLAAEALVLIHEEECAVRAVEKVVHVAVTGLVDDGDALSGSLTLTRQAGNEPVVATTLYRSVLVDVAAEGLPLELAGDERSGTTAVSFTPATCDPHVLSETKKPYVFPLTVQVGDDDPVPVDLPLDEAARDQLAALVQRVCADA